MDIEKTNILWIGSENSMEAKLLSAQDINFKSIPAAGLHGVGLTSLPGNLVKIFQGYLQSRKIIQNFQPEVIFYTGGFLSFPVSLAAGHIPSVVFIPDIEPGTALNHLIPRCNFVAATTDKTISFLPKNKPVEITGYPIRPSFKGWTKIKGKKELNLQAQKPVLLVFGGSKGSRSINRALQAILPDLLKEAQVIHITGEDNWDENQEASSGLPNELIGDYHPFSFLHAHQMGAAFASADLVVCRAGASTLGELPFFKLPAILVPYPHAWRYQYTNAEYLVQHGGALLLKDQELPEKLYPTITSLLHNPKRLTTMADAMQKLSHPDAAQKIGDLIISASKKNGGTTPWSV